MNPGINIDGNFSSDFLKHNQRKDNQQWLVGKIPAFTANIMTAEGRGSILGRGHQEVAMQFQVHVIQGYVCVAVEWLAKHKAGK